MISAKYGFAMSLTISPRVCVRRSFSDRAIAEGW
jgi:hypothetical protein